MESVIDKLTKNINESVEQNAAPFITYIIGNNGTGKSRLLAKICELYENLKTSDVRSILCISNSITDRFVFGDGHRRKYLGARNVGNAIFKSSIDREIAKYLIRGLKPGKTVYLEQLWKLFGLEFSINFPDEVKRRYKRSNLSATVDNRKLKNTAIENIIDEEGRAWIGQIIENGVEINKITLKQAKYLSAYFGLNPEVQLFTERDNKILSYSELSSGEQNRIATALKIIANAENNTLVLIDEPEISLHLRWQMDFHNFITEIMSEHQNYHVLIATHSPIIVSEAAKDPETDAIIVLQSATMAMAVSSNQLEYIEYKSKNSESFGSCEELTLDLFDTATYNTTAIDHKITEVILDATESGESIQHGIRELNELIYKAGISDDKILTIKEAIGLIERYAKGMSM
ncbi:putative ATPase [Pseudomonas sp. JUb42]|uniref:ATP-binding protein n=1 Tax=Pseudomonas sp. JUb42 TaxID=2940611 RepID=UPI002168DCA2|nr:ATP-binding protein [Pseudomonas sp. JUb42]MCS3467923.1 putative ATPase [Pseudomonas sp. JUb42]